MRPLGDAFITLIEMMIGLCALVSVSVLAFPVGLPPPGTTIGRSRSHIKGPRT